MFQENVIFNIDGTEYLVKIIRKRIRNSYLRCSKNDESFILTTNTKTSIKSLESFIYKSLPTLAKRKKRRKAEPFGEDYLYVLGEKLENPGYNAQNIQKFLKKGLLPIVQERVKFFEKVMNVSKPYNVIVRNNSSRFGSNSKRTHTLSFATCLYHYPMDVIDSVVIHELAHDFYFDHSKRFWAVVYKYCPNYKLLDGKLKKRIYGKDN